MVQNITDIGLKMTLLCGLLEKISIQENKSDAVISEIERLISMIDKTKLSEAEYEQLKNHLNNGKSESNRQRCIKTIKKYTPNLLIDGHTAVSIFNDAYSVRSAYSHGDNTDNRPLADYIFDLMLYLVNKYFKEKQQET